MKENAIIWIVILTVFIALSLATVGIYLYLDEAIRAYFLS